MRIDLHAHSDRSDGTDAPAMLVQRARATGLDVLGLTDHDTTAGWAEARAAGERAGLTVVPGAEISTVLDGASVHLLGYRFDPDHPELVAELARVRDGRRDRLPRTIDGLRAAGIDITAEQVAAAATRAEAPGRPHVADALVTLGVVGDRNQAFDRYLSPGQPGFVPRYGVPTEVAVELVAAAGGVSVLAHPWSRGSRRALTPERIAGLAERGLGGLEVDHPDHDPATRGRLRALAVSLDLVVTGASDHHGTGKDARFRLGVETTAPDEYDRLLAD